MKYIAALFFSFFSSVGFAGVAEICYQEEGCVYIAEHEGEPLRAFLPESLYYKIGTPSIADAWDLMNVVPIQHPDTLNILKSQVTSSEQRSFQQDANSIAAFDDASMELLTDAGTCIGLFAGCTSGSLTVASGQVWAFWAVKFGCGYTGFQCVKFIDTWNRFKKKRQEQDKQRKEEAQKRARENPPPATSTGGSNPGAGNPSNPPPGLGVGGSRRTGVVTIEDQPDPSDPPPN